MYPVPITHFVPKEGEPGFFGALRKHDIHTGIDLYTTPLAPVLALEEGLVVAIEDFTGPSAGSPWWNETKSILIEGASQVILYGELQPSENIKVGSIIKRGDALGHVVPVLKKDKGKNPASMLHLECYDKGTRQSVWWHHHQPQPSNLKNPLFLVQSEVYLSNEYCLIRSEYQDKVAKRSQIPLINHIHEGVSILDDLQSTLQAKKAFCLHPLLQDDASLLKHASAISFEVDPYVLMLAMEYRSIANQYLSFRKIASLDEIKLSPLPEVNDMLRADKLQNYKDFMLYHQKTHPRSAELEEYFNNWLEKLNIQEHSFLQQLKPNLIPSLK